MPIAFIAANANIAFVNLTLNFVRFKVSSFNFEDCSSDSLTKLYNFIFVRIIEISAGGHLFGRISKTGDPNWEKLISLDVLHLPSRLFNFSQS